MSCEPQPPILHPAGFRITPSKGASPWCAQWDEGARFSRQQLAEMERRKMDPATVDAVRVRRTASSAETWWPTNGPAPVHEYDCPILSRRIDGKLNILAPAGVPAVVHVDGWVSVPKQPKPWRKSWVR